MTPIALLRWVGDVLLLRGSPADAPRSTPLMWQFIVLDLISSVLYLQTQNVDFAPTDLLGRALLRVVLVYAILLAFGKSQRFVQTTLTLFAASAALTVITLPIAAGLVRSQIDVPDLDVQLLLLGYLGLLIWSIVVDAHVFRHALGLNFWYTLPLSVALFIIYSQLADVAFPIE